MKLISGTANNDLAKGIADVLDIPLTSVDIERFRDQEIFVRINENVRGEDIFLIQPTSAPANDHLMELLILIDALRRASAQRITAVVPYFGYARQDRKTGGRTPISAKLVANLICKAGADRVLTVDLHAGQIQGFFDIPTDNLFGQPVFISDIREQFSKKDREKLLFVALVSFMTTSSIRVARCVMQRKRSKIMAQILSQLTSLMVFYLIQLLSGSRNPN